jgi:hypothetical protein
MPALSAGIGVGSAVIKAAACDQPGAVHGMGVAPWRWAGPSPTGSRVTPTQRGVRSSPPRFDPRTMRFTVTKSW